MPALVISCPVASVVYHPHPQPLSHQRERGARKIFYTTDASRHNISPKSKIQNPKSKIQNGTPNQPNHPLPNRQRSTPKTKTPHQNRPVEYPLPLGILSFPRRTNYPFPRTHSSRQQRRNDLARLWRRIIRYITNRPQTTLPQRQLRHRQRNPRHPISLAPPSRHWLLSRRS